MSITDKVKVLEDVLVAYIQAHGELLITLSLPANRKTLSEGCKVNRKLWAIVDNAMDKHKAMRKRMEEINEAGR